jgi:hypothetical protein
MIGHLNLAPNRALKEQEHFKIKLCELCGREKNPFMLREAQHERYGVIQVLSRSP